MTDQHGTAPEPELSPELFIDFVNTLEYEGGEPVDHVGDGTRLLAWLAANGLCRPRSGASRVEDALPAFSELRDLTRAIVGRLAEGREPTAIQIRGLNAVMRRGTHYHQLRPTEDGARFTVAQVGDELRQALAAIAGSLAHYVADHDLRRLRVCANDGCRWLFVDHSPAGRRRWCDMRTCGNRAKVARHRLRARKRAASDGAPQVA